MKKKNKSRKGLVSLLISWFGWIYYPVVMWACAPTREALIAFLITHICYKLVMTVHGLSIIRELQTDGEETKQVGPIIVNRWGDILFSGIEVSYLETVNDQKVRRFARLSYINNEWMIQPEGQVYYFRVEDPDRLQYAVRDCQARYQVNTDTPRVSDQHIFKLDK